ncbi:MAG: hypothetical protein KF812_13350 [Fimbriimonadaceae bacterium]|nr:hypothetical protein [Fimbriimonadaceae bacterium]
MADDAQIVRSLNGYLQRAGHTCGRSYVDVGDAVKSIEASLPGETATTLEPKVKRLITTPGYGFKTRNNNREVSGSDATDPKCGGS